MTPPPFLGILTPLNEEDPPPLSQALLLYIGTTYIWGGGLTQGIFHFPQHFDGSVFKNANCFSLLLFP